MLDGMHRATEFLVGQIALEVAGDIRAFATLAQSVQHVPGADARREHIGQLAPAVGPVVTVDRDVVDVAQLDTGLGEAVSDRFTGKAAPVLDPPETLLFDGRDQLAVLHQAGSGIGVKGVKSEDVSHPKCLSGPFSFKSRRSKYNSWAAPSTILQYLCDLSVT